MRLNLCGGGGGLEQKGASTLIGVLYAVSKSRARATIYVTSQPMKEYARLSC